jgi:FtsP/CotA-like multicopper oxidase with cupredoxin domain
MTKTFRFHYSLLPSSRSKALLCLLATCVLWRVGCSQEVTGAVNKPMTAVNRREQLDVPSSQVKTYAPFVEPNVIKSESGVLKVTLNLAVAPNTVAGRVIQTATYNASLPGPTLRVRPGDLLQIRLINNLALPGQTPPPQRIVRCGEPASAMVMDAAMSAGADPAMFLLTNLHTHGLQVSPQGNGDNPLIDLKPGETCDYSIQVPPLSNEAACKQGPPYCLPQPAGLFWYHPHRHMSTSKQSWAGLAGAIIVEGDIDRIPAAVAAKERLIVLQELWVDNQGRVPAGIVLPVAGSDGTQIVPGTEVPFTINPPAPTNIYYVVNGVFQPGIPIQPGETQRWRILNASPHRVYKLYFEGNPNVVQIAQDGINLRAPEPIDQQAIFKESATVCKAYPSFCLAPGNRVEIVIQYPDNAASGEFRFKALAFEQGHPGGPLPEVTLATLLLSGPPIRGRSLPGQLPAPPANVTEACIQRAPVIFGGGATGDHSGSDVLTAPVQFPINGFLFKYPDPPPNAIMKARAGTCEEWTIINRDVFKHPFHIHVNPFQVISITANDPNYPVPKIDPSVWWDTIMLPSFSTMKIRTRYRSDVTGTTVFHCHFLPHEDNGMMTLFELKPNTGP